MHPEFIERRVSAYQEVLPRLRVHDPAYPDGEQLQAVIRASDPSYGLSGIGTEKHQAAADLIIESVDRDDPRSVWVALWGGSAPLAQALANVRERRSSEEVKEFVGKLRVYAISDQDDAGPWIRMTFPHLKWVSTMHGFGEYGLATWAGITHDEAGSNTEVVSRRWLRENIQSKGPLGALYPTPIFGMEGDTPSFLYLVPNGLGDPEHPNWGSWGGRYGKIADFIGLWTDVEDSVTGIDGERHTSNKATIWRWRQEFQNDFAARMDWSVQPNYADANHPPRPVINGAGGLAPVHITTCAGEPAKLSASGSRDPDGQTLSYRWLFYGEVNPVYSPQLKLSQLEGMETTAVVDPWIQPYKIGLPDSYDVHVVLAVRDDGVPSLTRYRRVVISIPTRGQNGCAPIEQAAWPEATDFISTASAPASRFSTSQTAIGELLDNAEAREVLGRHLPELVPQLSGNAQVRNMTLTAISHFDPRLTKELLSAIDEDLAGLK